MRTNGNQRRYGRGVLRAIAIIKVAQRAGIPLAAIRDRLQTLPSNTRVTAADWAHLSTEWRNELDDRIARLTRLRDQMSSCIGCGCLRSEEHTSELQSLMRISYAVFCLKKKKPQQKTHTKNLTTHNT